MGSILSEILDSMPKDGAALQHDDEYLCDKEVAYMFKVSRRTLSEYRSNGTLPYYVLGDKVLYKRSESQVYLSFYSECSQSSSPNIILSVTKNLKSTGIVIPTEQSDEGSQKKTANMSCWNEVKHLQLQKKEISPIVEMTFRCCHPEHCKVLHSPVIEMLRYAQA